MRDSPKALLFRTNFGAFLLLDSLQRLAVVGSAAMSSVPFLNTPDALRQLANQPHSPCQCSLQHCAGWESINDTAWPAAHMQHVATLRDPDVYEPTFEEQHPNGTRYESADAPVALKFFPTTDAMCTLAVNVSSMYCATPSLVATTLTTVRAA